MHFEFKSYNHFVRETDFPDFYWCQQRHGYSIWNFLSRNFFKPVKFHHYDIFKTGIKRRRQNDPSPQVTRVYQRQVFFQRCHSERETSAIPSQYEVSYFDNSVSSENSTHTDPSTFFDLTNQIHPCLRKTWHQIFP